MGKLDGKVAVVTGGAFGNGRAIALRYADEGANLVVADLDDARLEETTKMVRVRDRKVLAQHCDVSKKVDIDQLFAASLDTFGQVDVVVANAGVVETDTDVLRMTEDEWNRTIDVNLKGVFFTLQGGAQAMLKREGGGRLIAISSIMSLWGAASTPAYCASKGGVQQLVRSFALALGARSITCNAIGPGFIETGMTEEITKNPMLQGFLVDRTPAGRIGSPEDVASAAVFLASDDSSFVTGTTLFPDGGITAGLYSAAAADLGR